MPDKAKEPTYPSAEELMDQLGPDHIDMMRSMMDHKMKPGEEEDGEATRPELPPNANLTALRENPL